MALFAGHDSVAGFRLFSIISTKYCIIQIHGIVGVLDRLTS
jgi:hypothetical protein